MVSENLLLCEPHRLRGQTFATMAERLPWNLSAYLKDIASWLRRDEQSVREAKRHVVRQS